MEELLPGLFLEKHWKHPKVSESVGITEGVLESGQPQNTYGTVV